MTPFTPGFNPFPGLRPFQLGEEYLFFGREGQSDEVLQRLTRSRFVAVLGTSGSGKSSLIRAGLLPALLGGLTKAGSRWRIAMLRPGNDPIGNLAHVMAEPDVLGTGASDAETPDSIFIETTLRRSGLGLIEAVRQARLAPQENFLVIIDQFEELFRFRTSIAARGSADDAAAFVKLVLEATRQSEVPIYVAITMRSDFIGDCAHFRDLPEAINNGIYLIPRMTRDQRRLAITGPVAVAGAEIAPPLVNRLLNDAGEDPDKLPIMQHALMRTWEGWEHDHLPNEPVDLRHYEAVGGMQNALSRHADEAYDELSESGKRIAKKLFQGLTEKGSDNREIRRPATVAAITAVAQTHLADVCPVIDAFRRRSFLMPPEDISLTENTLLDISHESLIRGWERLHDWVDEEAESATMFHRLAEAAVYYRKGKAGLWRDPELALAVDWRDKERPSKAWADRYSPEFDAAMQFLERSHEAAVAEKAEKEALRNRELKRVRIFAAILLGALMISAYLGYQARVSAKDARDSEKIAKSNEERAKLSEAEAKRTAAENAKMAADLQVQIGVARKNEQEAKDAKQLAQEKQQALALTVEDQRLQALDRRKRELESNSEDRWAFQQLINASSEEEIPRWRLARQDALTLLGDHQGAIAELTATLRQHPDYPAALTNRGYEYILVGKPKEAEEDFREFLRIDPKESLVYLNLAISLAMQHRYAEAHQAMEDAIRNFQYSGNGLFDSQVSPDLQLATGRTLIYADQGTFRLALYYELASLEACQGGSGFQAALEAADREADQRRPDMAPYIVALNWLWLHARVTEEDYGALAGYGALWERAAKLRPQFRSWALYYYLRFEKQHKKRRDRRYDELARWVAQRQRVLGRQGERPREAGSDPATLAVEALEVQARAPDDVLSLAPANRLLTLAIQRVLKGEDGKPQQRQRDKDLLISLLLQRAGVRFRAHDYSGLRHDAFRVLRLAPHTPDANLYLGATDDRIGEDEAKNDPERLDKKDASVDSERHYQEVLKYDPVNSTALSRLGQLELNRAIAEKDPQRKSEDQDKALSLFNRTLQADAGNASIYYWKAQILNSQKRYGEALKNINSAISIEPADFAYYQERQKEQEGLGWSKLEVAESLMEGYLAAGDASARSGDAGEALSAYLRGLVVLKELSNRPEERQPVEEMMGSAMHHISDFLIERGSPGSAKEFWESAVKAGQFQGFENIVDQEIKRLSEAAPAISSLPEKGHN
jgi:tetratricopeptide (TPR) repeat protein